MFTGIIQQCGVVGDLAPSSAGLRLSLDTGGWSHQPAPGDSIAVDGCCLTVAEPPSRDGILQFDVVHQTLRMTRFGGLQRGDLVNLEHSVTPATLLDGHIVQGHIDGVGTVRRTRRGDEPRLTIITELRLMPFIVGQGSIAVNGVSLTVASVDESAFDVALIPATLERTNLRLLQPGGLVNIETDYVARTVVRWLERHHATR